MQQFYSEVESFYFIKKLLFNAINNETNKMRNKQRDVNLVLFFFPYPFISSCWAGHSDIMKQSKANIKRKTFDYL